ncbi:MAG: cellulose biosynthesis protein BcsS [Novosphingobium sp.]|nr:cellulose biosynthesis protein BcsS [Novosphingobium sp.]
MNRSRLFLLLVGFGLYGTLASPALAQDSGVVFAGGTVSDGVSAFAGGVVSLPGARLGDGLAIRGTVNGGTYHYRTQGVRIDAEYYGGEVAMVYQTSGAWGWANASVGARVTDTNLDPFDPANRLEGTRYDLALQAEGVAGKDWRLRWFGSLGVFDETYNLQAGLGRKIGDDETYAGLEVGLQGDPSYRTGTGGIFIETGLGKGWNGRLSGGLSEQAARGAKPYASIGVSHVF